MAAPTQLALARQPLVPPASLTNGLLNGGVPSPAAIKAAAGSTKAAAAMNSMYGQQVCGSDSWASCAVTGVRDAWS
jgi:hypothetical protein